MSVAALLLGDSRFPAGGHAHSGGVEPAVTAGTVTDLATLEAFLRGRLRTAGLVAAGIAALPALAHRLATHGPRRDASANLARDDYWALLDAEVDARIPSARAAGSVAAARAGAAARGAGRLAGSGGTGGACAVT